MGFNVGNNKATVSEIYAKVTKFCKRIVVNLNVEVLNKIMLDNEDTAIIILLCIKLLKTTKVILLLLNSKTLR